MYVRFCNYVEKKKFVSFCVFVEFGYYELVVNVVVYNGDGGFVGGVLVFEMNIFFWIVWIFRVCGSFFKF